MGKANQIAAAALEPGRRDTFAISASFAFCAAETELRQSQPKCIRLVELKEISAAAAADCFSTPPIHSADLYDTLVHFNFTLPLLFHLPACIEKAYAIASREE